MSDNWYLSSTAKRIWDATHAALAALDPQDPFYKISFLKIYTENIEKSKIESFWTKSRI